MKQRRLIASVKDTLSIKQLLFFNICTLGIIEEKNTIKLLNTTTMSTSLVYERSFDFALEIVMLYQCLQANKEFIISKQLLRSGTSIGANLSESLSAQSKKDFLHKYEIALKEARETQFWLRLLSKVTFGIPLSLSSLLKNIDEIIRMLAASIKTLKTNKPSPTTLSSAP